MKWSQASGRSWWIDVMTVESSGTWLSCCKEEGNVGKCVFGGLFLLSGSGWKLQTHPPTVCSICPGGRWACSDLLVWACERRGGGRNILLLSGWVGSSLPSLHAAFPGITPEPFASLSDYQVLVAVEGTCWISPASNLIQFDTGGSGLESD